MIGDDERPSFGEPRSGPSKQALRALLTEAVVRTGGEPIAKEESPERFPSAHQIAIAIVTAALELGADPELIAMGVTTRGGRYADHSIPRARAYAACAIREVFGCENAVIGRWVGAKLASGYLSTMDAQRRLGQVKWWDEDVFRRVVAELKITPREC